MSRPAYYARTGSAGRDLIALLHVPYTLWHLSYVAIGAAIAPDVDWRVLAGTVGAFAVGLGIGAHALDEVKSRPLRTGLSDRALWWLGMVAMAVALAIAVVGAAELSPWVLAWGAAGVLLAVGYALEWPWLHSDLGFALAWGAFPVVVGNWAQTLESSWPVVLVAAAATLLSLAQRALSTPARYVRRRTTEAGAHFDRDRSWDRAELLSTWEDPLRLLSWMVPTLAIGLLATHL
jgi:hypothetical protein